MKQRSSTTNAEALTDIKGWHLPSLSELQDTSTGGQQGGLTSGVKDPTIDLRHVFAVPALVCSGVQFPDFPNTGTSQPRNLSPPSNLGMTALAQHICSPPKPSFDSA
jgi:hypothetical protein